MPGDMERKCHSLRPTPGGLQPDTEGKELGRREGKVSESIIPSVPEALARNPSRNAQKANKRGPCEAKVS